MKNRLQHPQYTMHLVAEGYVRAAIKRAIDLAVICDCMVTLDTPVCPIFIDRYTQFDDAFCDYREAYFERYQNSLQARN